MPPETRTATSQIARATLRAVAFITVVTLTGCGAGGDVTAPQPVTPTPTPAPQIFCTTERIPLCDSPNVVVRVTEAIDDATSRSLPVLSDAAARTALQALLASIRTALASRSISALRASTTQATERLTSAGTATADAQDMTSIMLAVMQAIRLLEMSN